MKARYSWRTRALSGTLATILGLVLAAPPALAAEPQPATPDPAPAASLAAAAAAKIEALDPAEALLPAAPAPASDEADSPAFFKSPKGVAILLLFVGGTTAVLISKNRDRVKSQIR